MGVVVVAAGAVGKLKKECCRTIENITYILYEFSVLLRINEQKDLLTIQEVKAVELHDAEYPCQYEFDGMLQALLD